MAVTGAHSKSRNTRPSRLRRGSVVVAVLGVVAAYGVVNPGWASADTLDVGHFEIDRQLPGGANLVVDGSPQTIDWLDTAGTGWHSTDVKVTNDRPTGQGDDSFTQGTNINDTPTTITTGSIPNNKSDLTHFGIYVDKDGSEPIVNVFWTRVQAPHGTTTMDFEFNQLATRQNGISPPSNSAVNTHTIPLRKVGDILVTYFLESGGTHPTLTWRKWKDFGDHFAWGDSTEFTEAQALGAINTTTITQTGPLATAASMPTSSLSPYTFGEASLKLSAFVPPSDACTTFGSVYLRSRSSATDTDENKDFIAPEDVPISNCGSVTIHKSDAHGPLAGALFTIFKDAGNIGGSREAGDDVAAGTCTTLADGTCTVTDLHVGHYWAVETTPPDGHDAVADQPFEVSAPDINVRVPSSGSLDDPIQHGHLIVVKNALPDDPQDFTFTMDGGNGVTLDDDATLTPHSDTPNSHDYTVEVGNHTLVETDIPTGWVNTNLVCNGGSPSINLGTSTATVTIANNATVTCTYTDTYTPKTPDLETTASFADGSAHDVATLTGDGTHAVTGSVQFHLCGPTNAAASCAPTVGNKVGSPVAVVDGSATSPSTQPSLAGWYCYAAVYTSDSGFYNGTTHSNDGSECFLKQNANLTVSKTATPAFGRVYTWDVEKVVDGDADVSVPAGTTHAFPYKVTVTHSSTDGSWTVTGLITVTNPNNVAFEGVDVSDAIDIGPGACSVPDGSNVTVPANGHVDLGYTCTYASAPSKSSGTNTATATWDDAAYFTPDASASGTKPVDFGSVQPTTTDQFVTVTDTLQGELGQLDGATAENPTVYTYSIEQTAPDGSCTTVPNTASVTTVRPSVEDSIQQIPDVVTLDESSAQVRICGGLPLNVDAAAGGSFDREYLWLIDKSVDQTTITNNNGQSGTFNYTVKVTPNGTADSGYALSGTVTVNNPNDFEDIVADVTVDSSLGGGVTCTVEDGTAVTIPADDGKSFAYTCSFSGVPSLTGTVTAHVGWDATAASTTDDSADKTLPVTLVLATETNRTITVTDDKTDPANPVQLGTATYDDGEASFTYSLTKDGVPGTAAGPGCATYTNIAMIVETEQSDTQDVTLCHTFTGGGGTPVVNPPQGGGLPFTGDGIGLMARWSIGLILAGGLLLFFNRKKRLA